MANRDKAWSQMEEFKKAQGVKNFEFCFFTPQHMKSGVVSGLPGALYSICCLGVSTILESEKIVTMWPTND